MGLLGVHTYSYVHHDQQRWSKADFVAGLVLHLSTCFVTAISRSLQRGLRELARRRLESIQRLVDGPGDPTTDDVSALVAANAGRDYVDALLAGDRRGAPWPLLPWCPTRTTPSSASTGACSASRPWPSCAPRQHQGQPETW